MDVVPMAGFTSCELYMAWECQGVFAESWAALRDGGKIFPGKQKSVAYMYERRAFR